MLALLSPAKAVSWNSPGESGSVTFSSESVSHNRVAWLVFILPCRWSTPVGIARIWRPVSSQTIQDQEGKIGRILLNNQPL